MKQKKKISFGMFLVTIGIVYGDIGTSPLYVMKSILKENGGITEVSPDFIIGSLSLIIWTITLLTTIKYVLIAMKADNHGEGGIFSLYSLVHNCGNWLIVPAMVGGSALLADGILTPAVTVTTAVEGLRSIPSMDHFLGAGQRMVILITLLIIFALFMVQHAGTSTIGKAFGPCMLLWFSFLGITGLVMVTQDMTVLRAFNPVYAVRVLFSPENKVGFMILGSVFLATTGAEALYSDMGHVGKENIYISWPFVKICLILNYLGQGAWILNNRANGILFTVLDLNPFFQMLPVNLRPFAIILGAAAAVIASQALITGSYTLVSEAIRLNLMPHLEVHYPSDNKGQLYIQLVNTVLLIGCSLIVLYFQSSARMEAAYGLAITVTMLMTTLLLAVYLSEIRHVRFPAVVMLVVFGAIEFVFFLSSLGKFTRGGYVAVIVALLLFCIMVVWNRGTKLEKIYSVRLKTRDYIHHLRALKDDDTIPHIADNLVFLDGGSDDMETLDRDILYSILDKNPKRAKAYWFISVHVLDLPYAANYQVETYGTDFLFRVRINLGFRNHQRINVYLRSIIRELQNNGELPVQHRKYSIYPDSGIGSFRFCLIRKSIPAKSELGQKDEIIMGIKYAIRAHCGSPVQWYGLDTSSLQIEYVPLVIHQSGEQHAGDRLMRISMETDPVEFARERHKKK